MKQPPKSPNDKTGSEHTLRRLELQEVELYEQVEKARKRRDDCRTLLLDWDERAQDGLVKSDIEGAAQTADRDLLSALDAWQKIAKVLLPFDKGVDPSKRDGAKVSQGDAEKYLTSFARHTRVAYEHNIIAIAQDAIHCATPEDFYGMAAAGIRHAMGKAMETAHEEGKMPRWVMDAVALGL